MYKNEFSFPNWLGSQHYIAHTYTATDALDCVVTENGRKIIKSGAVFPKNDSTAIGIAFNRVDVTDGAKAIAIMVEGYVYEERLPILPVSAARAVMPEIKYMDYNPTEVRATKIEIKTAPTKVTYTAGEKVALAGTVIEITFSDGSSVEVEPADFAENHISYAPTGALKTTDVKITFTYTLGKVVQTDEQTITVS